MKIMRLVAYTAVVVLAHQALLRLARRARPFPAPAVTGVFLESGLRRRLQPPEGVLRRSGLRSGLRVLEIGCGGGALTIPAARTVGPAGRVYALDIQPAALRRLCARLAHGEGSGLGNVRPVAGSALAVPLADGTMDLVYLVSALQEVADVRAALAEARRVLGSGGTLAVSEFLPDPDYPWRRTTIRQGCEAGFDLEAVAGGLWHYTVRFRKPVVVAE